jgi:hypothetical protein
MQALHEDIELVVTPPSNDHAAKADYCAWAAQQMADPSWRKYLDDLARRWAHSATLQINEGIEAEAADLVSAVRDPIKAGRSIR